MPAWYPGAGIHASSAGRHPSRRAADNRARRLARGTPALPGRAAALGIRRPPPALSGSMRAWARTWRAESSSSRGRASASGARPRCASPPPGAGWRSPTSSIAPRPRRSPSAAASLGAPDVLAVSLQLADEDSICTLLERVIDRFGAVDILVNNAGVISWKPFLEQDFGEIDDQVNVNLLGVMKLTWCFLPLVTDAVITVGSTATLHQSRTPPTYCATKWGLRGFVKALALEHPDKRIVSVHPTVTATRMNDMRGMSPERVADVVYRVAAGEIEVEPGGDVDLRDYADA